jgi:hypothetical protein
LIVRALQDLTPEERGLRAAVGQWAIWQLAGHVAGMRIYYFHDWMGEGTPSVRELFGSNARPSPSFRSRTPAGRTTRRIPRNAAELVEGLTETWAVILGSNGLSPLDM